MIRRMGAVVASLSLLTVLTACAAGGPPPAEPTASGPTTSGPTASTTPSSAATVSVPRDCDELYPADLRKLISPDGLLVLNPAWMSEPGNERKRENGYGSFDPELISRLVEQPGLICDWAKASGGGEVFITTQVRRIDPQSGDAAVARMRSLGWACGDDLGGVWCTTEAERDGALAGESHLLRDGVWVATDWVNAGPQGYTAALARRIFG